MTAGSAGAARRYHHGNLREALVEAGVELARTGGPNAVVLRAASRRAGVTHNAAYRHFTGQEDLLAAVAQRCTNQLSRLMLERLRDVTAPGAEMGVIGRAYIDFARTEPGWFRTAFASARSHAVRTTDEEPTPSPYHLLSAQLDALVEAGALPRERRRGAEYAAWSAVHGLSALLLDGPLRELPEPEVQEVIDIVLAGIARGLA